MDIRPQALLEHPAESSAIDDQEAWAAVSTAASASSAGKHPVRGSIRIPLQMH